MLTLRLARREDAALIVEYIRELAAFEQLAHECHASEGLIQTWLFGAAPRAHCLLAEWAGSPAGFALYFYNFSTFLARPGIYIEDLFVRPDFRRKGIARSMFRHLAQKALAEGCGRLEWWVLDWNTDAIAFYASIGAVPMDEWTVQRVTGEALVQLAAG
jgi:GNAT superfamily N-acetyltransferase